MARVNNLNDFLTDVASAIKTKKGSEVAIPAANFDIEILALPSQGVYEQRVLNISANGTQTITPSSGFDAIDELELTVAVPEKQLQTKSYNFTQNTNMQLLPDDGYDGFDTVTLNINVPGSDLSDATITAQDVIKDKIAYGASGRIVGTLKGARYYATEEEMYADNTVEPVTYGLIYSELNNPLQNGDRVQIIKFPSTVVLDTAVTDNRDGQVMGHEGDIYLNLMVGYSATEVYIADMEGTINVEYTSADGITYTKTSGPDEYDLGGEVTVDDFENLLEVLGHFIVKTSYYQGGFYKYDTYTEETIVKMFDTNTEQLTTELFELPEELVGQEDGGHLAHAIIKTYHYDENRKINVVDTADLVGPLYNNYLAKNGSTFCIVAEDTWNNNWVKHYDFSLSNPLVSTDTLDAIGTYNGKNIYYNIPSGQHLIFGSANRNPLQYVSSPGATVITFKQHPMNWTGYKLAGNQYNLVNENQLLPGVQAYGKTGIVTGDGSIYNNLSITKLMQKMYGLSETISGYSKTTLEQQYFNNNNIVDNGCFCYDIPTGTQLQKETIYHLEPDNNDNMRLMLGKRTRISTTEQFKTSYNRNFYRYDYTSDKIIYIGYTSASKIEFIVYDTDGNVLLHSPSISTTISDVQTFDRLWYYNNKLYFISYYDSSSIGSNIYEVTNSGMTKKTSNNIGRYTMGKCFDDVNGIFYFTSSDSTSSTSSVFTMKQYTLSTNRVTKLLNVNSATFANSSKNYVAYCNADNTTAILRYKLKTASSWTNLTLPFSLPKNWWNNSAYLAEDAITGKLLVAFRDSSTGSKIVKIDPSTNTYTTLEGPTVPSGTNPLVYVNDVIYYGPNVTKILPDGTTYKYAAYNNSSIQPMSSYKLEICDTNTFKISGLADSNASSTVWPTYYFEPRSIVPGFSNDKSLIFAKTNYDLFAIGNWKETLEVVTNGENE